MFYQDKKRKVKEALESSVESYNETVKACREAAVGLYETRKEASNTIDTVADVLYGLNNVPVETLREISEIRGSIKDFREAVSNEETEVESTKDKNGIVGGVIAAGGVAVGAGVATTGASAAIAIATTFGTASTGTAISALSGAAATNAALAWLGGGAVAAGGGGMAAGNVVLASMGPVGAGIAACSILGGAAYTCYKNKKVIKKLSEKAEEIDEAISELNVKVKEIELLKKKTGILNMAVSNTIATMSSEYPKDCGAFSQEQNQVMASLIDDARSMATLINKRISNQ